jgi:hypothetical protein
MANWYDKYMSIYGRPFSNVPQEVIVGTRERLARLQSTEPLASIVIIAYNEETGEVRSGQVEAPENFGYWLQEIESNLLYGMD